MSQSLELTVRGTIRFVNNRGGACEFILEPWGSELVVPEGATVEVTFSGPREALLQVELRERGITLYGWQGAILSAELSDPRSER